MGSECLPGTPTSVMSTSSSLALLGDRILSVKSVANIVHTTTTHAYSFSKYIFLRELENPRPYRPQENPQVIRHGLLRYTNQNIQKAICDTLGFDYRLWNQDLVACLNILATVRSLRLCGTVPVRFQRPGTPARRRRRRRLPQQEDQR